MTHEYRKEAKVIFFRGVRRKEKLGETEIVYQMTANCTMIADGVLALLSLSP